MTRWSNKPQELALEIENIIDTLNNYAYSLNDNVVITDSVQSLLFSTCNHLTRIVSDLERIEEN